MAAWQTILNAIFNSTSSLIKVGQAAHDSLNANANLQVGNTDVAAGNPVPTSLTGSSIAVPVDIQYQNLTDDLPIKITTSVKQKTIHDSVAIRDTNAVAVTLTTTDIAGRKNIFVINLLDQSVTISVSGMDASSGYEKVLGSKAVAGGIADYIFPSDIAGLAEPFSRIKVTATCSVSPASGTLKTYMHGVVV